MQPLNKYKTHWNNHSAHNIDLCFTVSPVAGFISITLWGRIVLLMGWVENNTIIAERLQILKSYRWIVTGVGKQEFWPLRVPNKSLDHLDCIQ